MSSATPVASPRTVSEPVLEVLRDARPKFRVVQVSPRYHPSTDAILGCYLDPVAYAYTLAYARRVCSKLSVGQSWDDAVLRVEQRTNSGAWDWTGLLDSTPSTPVCSDADIPF
jgi:hypothetical protein